MKLPSLVIFDLDGTLISRNSFRAWTIEMFLGRGAFERGIGGYIRHLGVFSRLYALRALGMLSHGALKRRFLEAWMAEDSKQADRLNQRFASRLLQRFAQGPVLERLRVAQERNDVVLLVTAAPELYVRHIAAALGIEAVLATELPGPDGFKENVGTEKVVRLERWIGARMSASAREGLRVMVITDHEDDLPLIRRAQSCMLVNPTRELCLLVGDKAEATLRCVPSRGTTRTNRCTSKQARG